MADPDKIESFPKNIVMFVSFSGHVDRDLELIMNTVAVLALGH